MGDIISKIFGGPDVDQDALRRFRPVNLNGGGLSSTLTGPEGNRTLNLTPSAERTNLVRGIQDVLRGGASDFRGLRDQVRPGFGRLTEARLAPFRSARQRAVGNLRENLSRRRVLGSSFAQDAISRAESEFAQQEERVRAQSFLEELDLTTRLIDRETQLASGAFQTALNDLNLQAEVGTQLATGATAAMQRSAELQAQIAQDQAAGAAELVGFGLSFI